MGRHRCHVPAVLAGSRLLVQEDSEDGCLSVYLDVGHHLLHVNAGCLCRTHLRLVKDGLHLPGRYAGHEFHHYYL